MPNPQRTLFDLHRSPAKTKSPEVEAKRRSRRSDPETSRKAIKKLTSSGKLGGQRLEVYEMLRKHDRPVTAGELARDHKYDRYKISRRLPELVEMGYAKKCGERECTAMGSDQETWLAIVQQEAKAEA